MRYLRAVAACGVLLLILGGTPLALIAAIGDPRRGWGDVLAGDVSDTALLDVLATMAWLAWAYFCATVIVEAAQVAGTPKEAPTPRLSLGPGRHLARTLVTAVLVALPLAGPAQAYAGTPHPAAVAVATAMPTPYLDSAPVPATATAVAATTAPTAAATAVPAAVAPTAPAAEPGAAAAGGVREYVITRRGPGTFWDLAQTYLGDGQRWQEIWALNEGRAQPDGTRLRSPGLLRTGWTILLPATATGATSAVASTDPDADVVYVVRDGDRLGTIAERFLGERGAYTAIRDANTDLMPARSGPRGPDHIETGWHLSLPADAHDRGKRPHATGPARSQSPEPARERAPASSSPPAPTPTTAAPVPDTTSAPTPSTSDSELPTHTSGETPGISLPHGWVDLPLAAALVAAAAAVWLRRRLVYMYPPSDENDLDPDSDLQALPVVVSRLRRAVREHAERLPDVYASPGDPDRGSGVPRLPLGDAGTAPAPALQLPLEGLGLIGNGAIAAARALLVSALTDRAIGTDTGGGADVLITRPAVDALLPGCSVPDGLGHRLMIGADQDEILLRLQRHHRHRSGPPAAPVLVIAEVPPPSKTGAFVEALAAVAPTGGRAVFLGDWSPRPTLTVAHDGRTTSTGPGAYPDRIAVLDEPTTVSLLQVLQEASTSRPRPAAPPATTSMDNPAPRQPLDPEAVPPSSNSSEGLGPAARIDLETDSTSNQHPGETDSLQRVKVSLLGRPMIFRSDGKPVNGLRRHATELLVYLAVHRDGARLPEIMEALWPDATVRRAQQRLSTETANLRRTIRTVLGDPDVQPVVNTGGHYHLDPGLLDVDLWRLLDHLDAAAAIPDPHRRADELRAALSIPSGVLAQDCDYDWIDGPREHLRRRSIRALLALAEHPDSAPRDVAALTLRAADLDPASEDLTERAIRALADIGEHEAIPERLERLHQALKGIGEQPSARLRSLAADLRAPARGVPR